jgi:hypothetical protein
VITEHDLQEAIAECEGQRNPTSNTCLKLAAFYIIKDKMFPMKHEQEGPIFYSRAEAPMIVDDKVEYESDTEFGRAVYGMTVDELMPIIDELMTTLSVLSPKLYGAVMRKVSPEY